MRTQKTVFSAKRLIVLAGVAALVLMFKFSVNSKPSPPTDCPDPPPVTLSPDVPRDVCIPPGSRTLPIYFFDDYSWKIFIALAWPAKQGQRGVPDRSKKLTDAGPRVFETYRTSSEVFLPDASAPSAWNVYDDRNPAHRVLNFGEFVLGSYNHLDYLAQAGFVESKFEGPVATRNDKYTMVLTAFDENEFTEIKDKKWFIKANLRSGLRFQNGAIDIKTAWMDMDGISEAKRSRYYTVMAWVMDPNPGGDFKVTKKLVGLVGMHIVQRTATRPQWLWSTYEQVDNLPGEEGADNENNYFRPGGDPMKVVNPNKLEPLTWPPKFYNIKRVKPISPHTKETNVKYQQALKEQGSVLQYYKLVMTQWPTPGNNPDSNGGVLNTIPGAANPAQKRPKSDSTSFANITMETYQQSRVGQGCMACHNTARDKADYLWTMLNHAGPNSEIPSAPPSMNKTLKAKAPQSKEMKELNKLLGPETVKGKK